VSMRTLCAWHVAVQCLHLLKRVAWRAVGMYCLLLLAAEPSASYVTKCTTYANCTAFALTAAGLYAGLVADQQV
jgi:hypothetical protein